MGLMERRRMMLSNSSGGGGGWRDYYRPIEWLGVDGTQYIRTNYIPSADNTEITMEYAFTVTQSGDGMLFGAHTGDTSNKTWQAEFYNHNAWYVGVGEVQYRSVLFDRGNGLNTKYTLHATAEQLEVAQFNTTPTQTRTGANNLPISIFAWTRSDADTSTVLNKGARIYSLTFKENGTVAANFVPCIRKADGVPGMYDTVSETFYTNNGTGSFIVPS